MAERMADCGRRVLVVAALILAAGLAFTGQARAQSESADRWVTIAARECDNYTDIRANLARNDIQESLQDLGEDTLYQSGDPVDPRTELEGQPNCRPITDWQFTFGSSYQSKAVSGPWGELSIVTNVDGGQQIVTRDSVPARDFNGHPVGGGATIAGAVTVGLNRDQVDRADGNRLWLQGGTPTDPVLFSDPEFAGRYGFGALRCAIDDLNGDNVETIQFPSGTRHMYCYAYYVTPPPSSGKIVIRKEVTGSQADETFGFGGNVSYNNGGAFDLSASDGDPDSVEFVRAETRTGDPLWTVTEDAHEGWTLTGITCTSASSTASTDLAARNVQISLVAGDTVTCTYSNRLTPPAGALVVRKVTEGGTGAFPFRIRDADGDVVTRRTLTTRAEGGVGAATVIKLDPGRYRISERRPRSRAGLWRLAGVRCNGEAQSRSGVTVEITAGRGAVCTFTNRLDTPGRIDVRGVTLNGLAAAGYVVTPLTNRTVQRRQFASTRRQGEPALARGQSTHGVPFGRYVIQQTALTAGESRVWSLVAVTCNGRVIPFAQGRVVIRLTRAAPTQRCTFINLRQRDPEPPDPPTPPGPVPPGPVPPPDPDGPVPVPGEGTPDLAITKRQIASTGGQQPILTFRLRVTNNSAVTAKSVVVADRLAASTAYVSANPSQGSCRLRGARLVLCTLGDLAPGASATIRVRVQQIDPGPGLNLAAAGAGSPEDVLRNNVAAARISAVRPLPPRACGATAPIARAAC